jgi:peptidoglycan/LPS O-acetylase OafA/YrhL
MDGPVRPIDFMEATVPLSHLWLYRAEVAASLVSAALLILCVLDPQWIERWFDESPDGGDGSAERWIVGSCFLVAALIAAVLARRERRRPDTAAAARVGD